jgi:hypothetical protein
VISLNTIRVANNRTPGLTTFYVPSDSRAGKEHTCQFIRRGHRRRWLCTCENFTYDKFAKLRHCKHLKRIVTAAKEHGGVTRLVRAIQEAA